MCGRHHKLSFLLVMTMLVEAGGLLAEEKTKKNPTKAAGEKALPSAKGKPSKLAEWAEQARAKMTGKAPRKFIAVKSISKFDVKVWELDYEQLNEDGYFHFVSKEEFATNQKINIQPWKLGKTVKPGEDITLALKGSGAQLLIMAAKPKSLWQLISLDSQNVPFKLYSANGIGFDEWSELLSWIEQGLGFHGIVLDQKENIILITSRSTRLRKGTKATIIKDSASEYVIQEKTPLAISVIDSAEGPYATLKLAGNTKIPLGSKIIIERQTP